MSALEARCLQPKPLSFQLGALCMTPGVARLMEENGFNPFYHLGRHGRGDWGELCEDDQAENCRALEQGGRLFSSYTLGDQFPAEKIWIITEADRSVTTILLPDEY